MGTRASLEQLDRRSDARPAIRLEGLTKRFGDRTALLFPALHLARDLAWVAAILVWLTRRAGRYEAEPSHSMRPRIAEIEKGVRPLFAPKRGRTPFSVEKGPYPFSWRRC